MPKIHKDGPPTNAAAAAALAAEPLPELATVPTLDVAQPAAAPAPDTAPARPTPRKRPAP